MIRAVGRMFLKLSVSFALDVWVLTLKIRARHLIISPRWLEKSDVD